jgi:hypothetical protein
VARAVASSAEVTVPQYGSGSGFKENKYLHIVRRHDPQKAGVFVVSSAVREGATDEIHVLPGQLGLGHDEVTEVVATPATAWAYRRSQLFTTNGRLVLGVLCVAFLSAWIDGTLALGKLEHGAWLRFQASTLDAMAFVSWVCKLASPMLAFLLALWFKK